MAMTHEMTSKRLSRRSLLTGAGATLVLVAGAGVYRAIEQDVFSPLDGLAYEPWQDWRDEAATGPVSLVAAAILASNAHNTQPWMFRVSDVSIDLLTDRGREIGAVDPFHRELELSLGCALENLTVAARAKGYEPHLTLLPEESDPAWIARIDLVPGEPLASPLYTSIPERHTNRYAYDLSRDVSIETLDAMHRLSDSADLSLSWMTGESERAALADLLVRAGQAINDDEEQSHDNIGRWLRHDADDVQRYRDGLTMDVLGAPGWEEIAGKLMPSPSSSMAEDSWLKGLKRQASKSKAFGMISVRDEDDIVQRLETGRLWQRLHLWLTSQGLAGQPMNQIHERVDRERQLDLDPVFRDAQRQLFPDPAWQPLFTFRFGYPRESAPPSPRRPVSESLTEA
jgi:nitroreductase